MEENKENVSTSHDDEDNDGMDDKEINHNKKDNQTSHAPTKRGTHTRKKRKISPFDSCVLKLNEILSYLFMLCCTEVLVICCRY